MTVKKAIITNESNEKETNRESYITLLKFFSHQEHCVDASEILCCMSLSENLTELCKFDKEFSNFLTETLLRSIDTSSEKLCLNSLKTLINLSDIDAIGNCLYKLNASIFLMNQLKPLLNNNNGANDRIEFYLMMLSNISRYESLCFQLLNIKKESDHMNDIAKFFIQKLFRLYSLNFLKDTERDVYFYVGYILTNVTRYIAGRSCLLSDIEFIPRVNDICYQIINFQEDRYLQRRTANLQVLVHLTNDKNAHKNLLQTQLISSLCCLIYPPKGDERRKLTVDHNSNWFPLPVVTGLEERYVPEEIDEKSFGLIKDLNQREHICSIFQGLISSPEGCKKLQELHVYNIIRIWHLIEKDENLKSSVEVLAECFVSLEES